MDGASRFVTTVAVVNSAEAENFTAIARDSRHSIETYDTCPMILLCNRSMTSVHRMAGCSVEHCHENGTNKS